MIEFTLKTCDDMDRWKILLPAIPHRGNIVQLGRDQYTVAQVIFSANSSAIILVLERV